MTVRSSSVSRLTRPPECPAALFLSFNCEGQSKQEPDLLITPPPLCVFFEVAPKHDITHFYSQLLSETQFRPNHILTT